LFAFYRAGLRHLQADRINEKAAGRMLFAIRYSPFATLRLRTANGEQRTAIFLPLLRYGI
jgi:hypothetical protein